MRWVVLFFLLLFLAYAGYAWHQNPAACTRLAHDATEVIESTLPLHLGGDDKSIPGMTRDRLVVSDGSPIVLPADDSIHYFAIYYAAKANPGCQAFSPALVKWYKKFKPTHPNFELIFVSEDPNEVDMYADMKESQMPWPAVKFSTLAHGENGGVKGAGIEALAGATLPDLVLTAADGTVLSRFDDADALTHGPDKVLADLERLVPYVSGAASASGDSIANATSTPPAAPATAAPQPPAVTLAPLLPPIKRWIPPAHLPAQPNWTWTTLDGTTYQNVIVTKVAPDTVSIMHAMGAAHVEIAMLPKDIQAQLNYDPEAAREAKAEVDRETAHPYYAFAQRAEAQEVARRMNWPVAWVESFSEYFDRVPTDPDDENSMTRRSMDYLKSRAIVIFANGTMDLGSIPAPVVEQLFHLDDGPLPDGHHFLTPKIVLTNFDLSKIYGRVPYTQLKASGEAAIGEVLDTIPSDTNPAPTHTPSAGSTNVPSASPETTPTAPLGSTSASDASPPPKAWSPPAVLPTQANWTWITSDGTTYQNVVVTKVEPQTVSISHSTGVAHVPIANLAPSIQQQLNYDPQAAHAAQAEIDREQAHPYYEFAQRAQGQDLAHQMHWPVAWVECLLSDMTATSSDPGDEIDLTQKAVAHLKSHAIVIIANGNDDLGAVPDTVREQLFHMDDGPLPGGHHFYAPKIVLTNFDATKVYGRAWETELKDTGEIVLDQMLANVTPDASPSAPNVAPPTPVPAASASPVTSPK